MSVLATLLLFYRKSMMSAKRRRDSQKKKKTTKTLIKNHINFGCINEIMDEMSFDYYISVCSRRTSPNMSIAHPNWIIFYSIKMIHFESPTCKTNTMNQKTKKNYHTRSPIIQCIVYSLYHYEQRTLTIFGCHCIRHFM